MKNDFKKMEEEMDNLSVKMSAITAFNDKISNTLQEKRLQITKLSGVHALLRKVCKFSTQNSSCIVRKLFFEFRFYVYLTSPRGQVHNNSICQLLWSRIR